jgi:cytochrome bd ubiquinol oxidase subunit II
VLQRLGQRALERHRDGGVEAAADDRQAEAFAGPLRHRDARTALDALARLVDLFALVGVGMSPTLVRAKDQVRSLTVHNAASSPDTLSVTLNIALIGIPFVLAYTIGIYWVFRGKVRRHSKSY